jgi:DNA-binding winged helix-turn-helix (wHTH) protein
MTVRLVNQPPDDARRALVLHDRPAVVDLIELNIVDRHIRSLRIKLQNDYRHPRFIATVPGKGYRFIPTFSNQGWDGGSDPAEDPPPGDRPSAPAEPLRRDDGSS